MAAHAALTFLWLLFLAPQERPLLVEVRQTAVPVTVRSFAVGPLGQWYLADPEGHTVTIWMGSEESGARVGGYGWGLSALDHPSGVATDGNRVYVADQGNHRIVSYDRSLRPLAAFSTRDTSDVRSRFGFPASVAVSGRGDLIVLDGESGEVVGFRPDGRVAFRVGRELTGGTPLAAPTSLAVDDEQRLLIGDAGSLRRLDLFGNQLEAVPIPAGVTIRGVAGRGPWIAAVSADTLYLFRDDFKEVHRWPKASIAPGLTLVDLRGVAWHEHHLLVLSAGLILSLRIES